MENKDKPAYPLEYPANAYDPGALKYYGLSKREMFAMAAMQGLAANSNSGSQHIPTNLIREAIELADQLLKQLES